MRMKYSGNIQKMLTALNEPVNYRLPIGDQQVDMNALIGEPVKLTFEQTINCIACGRKTSKSFNQGYCYPCFKSLAQCDTCIVKPELCHFAAGTCREPDWAMQHCMQDHYVYLANSSGLKVGITRGNQIPTRWMDQGAVQALPFFRVRDRLHSGLVEVIMAGYVADKTSWQAMLKGKPEAVDLVQRRDQLLDTCNAQLDRLIEERGADAIQFIDDQPVVDIHYPVTRYPSKVKSFNFDKTPEVAGTLLGIKGQYLILDTGVLNMRKFGGYRLSLEV